DAALDRIGYTLQPFDIVLMHTVASAAYGRDDYIDTGIGFGREATLHLTGQGVRVVGTDAWGWDLPIADNRRLFEETGDPSVVWEGHKAGADVAYCQIEKLQNLEELPATRFTVACFPTKVRRASAGWTRAVAIFDRTGQPPPFPLFPLPFPLFPFPLPLFPFPPPLPLLLSLPLPLLFPGPRFSFPARAPDAS